jgi:hypothetical protein
MATDAGQLTGERLQRMALRDCAQAACDQLDPEARTRVHLVESPALEGQTV